MFRLSAFIKSSLLFLVVYTIYSAAFLVYDMDHDYDKRDERNERRAVNYIEIGKSLLRDDDVSKLSDLLDSAIATEEIDYYLIRKNNEDVVFSSSSGATDPILFTDTAPENLFQDADNRHVYTHVGPYYLAIGHKISVYHYVRHYISLNRNMILSDLAFVTLMVLILVLFSFRDLRSVLKSLRSRRVNRGDLSVAKSAEAFTLVQGIIGYQANADILAKENALLKGQVLPALKKELMSGRPTPYEFGCTLVRTDINNFTTIFTSRDRAQFMATINEFFVGVSHIVSRYRGFVYEFIGDEVIFYFKDEDHINSSAIAMSALREINELANQTSERTEPSGYQFRVKSSLSWGTLRFGPLVNGFSLAGRPLIETVRLLTHVHEKSNNTILFDQSIADRTSFLATSREQGVVLLKGLSQSRTLHIHESFVPLSYQLRQEDPKHFVYVGLYRSNANICETLDYVRSNVGKVDKKLLQQLLSHFKNYRVTQTSVEIRKCYTECLERLVLLCETDRWAVEEDVFMLSTLVAAAADLFPPEKLTGRLRASLLKCLEVQDRRVIANTLDVFGTLEPDAGDEVFANLAKLQDNRIGANAIIKQAKRDWDRQTAKRLEAMLHMKSPYYKASALFALGEIASYLRSIDSVSYHTDTVLQALLEELPTYVEHANKMVRRQCMRAFMKAGREPELAQLLRDTSLEVEIRNEIKEFFSGEQVAAETAENAEKAQLRAV